MRPSLQSSCSLHEPPLCLSMGLNNSFLFVFQKAHFCPPWPGWPHAPTTGLFSLANHTVYGSFESIQASLERLRAPTVTETKSTVHPQWSWDSSHDNPKRLTAPEVH